QRHNAEFRELVVRLDPDDCTPAVLRETAPFATGLYGVSEMFVEGFLDLMRAGVLKREVDGALLHAAFFLDSRGFYRALREMPESDLAKLRMGAVSFVNELYGGEAQKRRARVKARFVNNAMMATLLGAVVSDALENGQVVSGVGGHNTISSRKVLRLPARARSSRCAQPERRGGARPRPSFGTTATPPLRVICATSW